MHKKSIAIRELVILDYRSYELPFVVRLMQPKLYKNGKEYHCLLENCGEQLSGHGSSSKEALENWAYVFRQCVKKIPAQEVNDYVRQLKTASGFESTLV